MLNKLSKKYKLEVWSKFNKNHIFFKNFNKYKYQEANYYYIKNNFNPLFFYIDYNASLDFNFLFLLNFFNFHFIVPPRRTPFNFGKKTNIIKRILNKNLVTLMNVFSVLIKDFIFRIFNKLRLFKRPYILFSCGSLGPIYWSKYLPDKIINTNSVDINYDKVDSNFSDNYVVYIDESKLYSPDLSLINNKDPSTVLNKIEFYQNLRNFFDRIEKNYSTNVIISCSYKYEYDDEKIFGDRILHYGKTNELIKKSKFVICHHSSGYWQAIYEKKKIIFLTDHNLNKFNQNIKVKNNADLLGLKTIDTKDNIDLFNFKLDKKKYEKILQDYFISINNINYDKVLFEVINDYYI